MEVSGMEYIHAALVLHAAGKQIDEAGIVNILKAAGIEVDEARVRALVSALKNINIDEAIRSVAIPAPVVAPAQTAAPAAKAEEKKVEEKKEEEKKEEEALAGLGALFG